MSEQFQRGDWKIEQENQNRFHLYRYDGTQWGFHHVADREGATNFITDDLMLLRIDRDGTRYFRPKK